MRAALFTALVVALLGSPWLPAGAAGAQAPEPERRVSLNLNETPLRQAIQLLFEGSGLQYAIDPQVPNLPITLNVKDLSITAALRTITRLASSRVPGLTFVKDGEVFIIKIREQRLTPREPEPPEVLRDGEGQVVWQKIPLHFIDVSVTAMMFGATILPPSADSPKAAPAGPRRLAPRALPAAPVAPARLEPAIPADEAGPPTPAPPGRPQFPAAGPFCGGVFAGPGFGAGGFGSLPSPGAIMLPPGIQTVVGLRTDNSLLVHGTRESIEELKQLVRLVDIPAKVMRLRISAGTVAAEGQALNNTALHLSDAAGGDRLSVVLVPRVNGDGTIDVTVNGTVIAGGGSRLLAAHVRVSAWRPTVIAALGAERRAVRVWLRASLVTGAELGPPVLEE